MRAPRRSRRWLVLLLLSAGVVVPAEPAGACSYPPFDPRDLFADADAAFIGELVDKEPVSSESDGPGGPFIFTFEVTEVVKGDLGELVEVVASGDSAACGLSVTHGGPIGLLLHGSGETWSASLIDEMTPEELRRAAAPLPRPNGVGPVRFLVGGSVGPARTLALDARGRTLAYGFRDGVASLFAVCPRARRAIEVASFERAAWLVVRKLPTLRIVRRAHLASRGAYVAALACRDARARRIFALVVTDNPATSRIVEVRGRAVVTIHRRRARSGAFAGAHAYLTGDAGLVSLDLESGRITRAARGFRFVAAPCVSPSGTRLAALASRRLVVFDLRRPSPRIIKTRLVPGPAYGSLVWVSDRRLALLRWADENERSLIFTSGLRRVGSLRGWLAQDSAGLRGRLYGLDYDHLLVARLPYGPIRVVRHFDSPELYEIVAIHGRVGQANTAVSSC